ncbi:hypothetical protein BCR44DRAFT_1433868 [Catenaria anguillulae PL171]|uniref:Uncharacterized protein n=1 Tax=Catenaria anguillulae PL171 TaxID=765915 RepID=A0A1Y2HR70_9FUNG|nr:hypothetical protein BCR44DRAFT_1433868 [Catenaria anguillulae PL171]
MINVSFSLFVRFPLPPTGRWFVYISPFHPFLSCSCLPIHVRLCFLCVFIISHFTMNSCACEPSPVHHELSVYGSWFSTNAP